jgi:hypothetical protein
MEPFNALSTTATTRKIPPLKEESLAKVMPCVLITLTDLHKYLDASKEATGGAGAPFVKMAGRAWFVANRSPLMRTDHHQHTKVTLTRPTTGILTPRKVTIQHQLVVPSSSSDDDLLLVKHDAQVDLNPSGARIHYT